MAWVRLLYQVADVMIEAEMCAVGRKPAQVLPAWIKRDEWKRLPFGAFVQSVNQRVEPSQAGDEIYVGLEHLDPQDLHIRRWGKGSDVIGTKLCFRKGDLIFGRRRAYQRKLAVAEFDGICSAHAMVVRAKPDVVLPEFLPFLMMSDRFMNRAVEISVGSLSPTINWTTLKLEEFALPPLDQQRRIAEILWAMDGMLNAYNQASATADAYIASHLLTALGNSSNGQREQRFTTVPLRQIARLQTGIAKGKSYLSNVATVELPYLRVANVHDGFLDLSDLKTIVIREADRTRFLLQEGDVVICEGGDFDKVGRGTIWRGEVTDCVHQNHVFCLRADKSVVMPEFIALQLGSPYGKQYFLGCAKKTSNLASINSSQVKAFPFQLPTLKEQQTLVAETQRVEETKQALAMHHNSTQSMLRNFRDTLT